MRALGLGTDSEEHLAELVLTADESALADLRVAGVRYADLPKISIQRTDGQFVLGVGGDSAEPIAVGSESRTFLQDGDEVVMRGRCEAPGAVPIGFGECRGVVVPA